MAQGTDSQMDPVVGLEAPERDRLYREWILPHLKLSDDHRAFVETVLGIPGAKDFHSFPGQYTVELDEHAPTDRLAKLSCCLLTDRKLELAGPREGGLLVPVTDPHGRLTAFRILSNSQMARMRDGHEPDTVMWWQAASALRPMMPNGEHPIHAARSGNADTVVLMKGVARASAIAAKWKCHGISTAEDVFSFHTTVDYLHEFLAKNVCILSQRVPSKKEAMRTWTLANQLMQAGMEVKILVPVLSDLAFPDSLGECTTITIDVWTNGLPKAAQQDIARKKRAASVPESAKMDLSAEELNERIMNAYEEFTAEGKKPDIGSLAAAAGVHWERVMDWLKDRGVDNTTQLQIKMDSGWEPPVEIDPLAPPPETRAGNDSPSLFDFARENDETSSRDDSGEALESAEEKPAIETLEKPVPTDDNAADTRDAENDESIDERPESMTEAKATTDGTLPDKAPATSPAPAAESSATQQDAANGTNTKKDGTIELVVEAQESILESETPLTQVINSSQAPKSNSGVPESKARIGLVLIALALLLVAFALIGTFGLPRDDVEKPWETLPITEKELLPAVEIPAMSQPVYHRFDVKEVAVKIKDASETDTPEPASEGE